MEVLKSFLNPLRNSYNLTSHTGDGILKNQYKLLAKAIIIENNCLRKQALPHSKRAYVTYKDCLIRAQNLGVNFVWFNTENQPFEHVKGPIAKRAMLHAQLRYVDHFKSKYTYRRLTSETNMAGMLGFLREHGKDKKYSIDDINEMSETFSNLTRHEPKKIKKANNLLKTIWVCKLFNPFLPAQYKSKDKENWAELDDLLINS